MHNYACIPSQGKFILPSFEDALKMLDVLSNRSEFSMMRDWQRGKLNLESKLTPCWSTTFNQLDQTLLLIHVYLLPFNFDNHMGWFFFLATFCMESSGNQKFWDFIDEKKVSVRGGTIWMIYVAIRKVICSLDLAASSLHGWQNYFKTRYTS